MLSSGCLENPHGFFALRNPDSKWHIPYEDMPDSVVGAFCPPLCFAGLERTPKTLWNFASHTASA